jgi:hypothetical protein
LIPEREIIPIEIKSGATFQQDWCKNLIWFSKLQKTQHQYLVYGGESSFDYPGLTVSPLEENTNAAVIES